MGPANPPPNERFVYSCASCRAAGSVHCSDGESRFRLPLRTLKLVPDRERRFIWPPENPPRDTSYGAVTSDDETPASRGMFEPPKSSPLSVVLFWSWVSPSTEYPEGSPSS